MSSDKHQFMALQADRKRFMEMQLAFQQDVENLLLKYKMHNTFSFNIFSEIWVKLKFGLIYSGKYRSQEFGNYTEMVYFIVKKYFMHSDSLHIQVGAFYLLYALYYKNPFFNLVKIRLLKDELLKLQELMSIMRAKRELEILYIYNKMLVNQVFDFVKTHYVLGIETKYLQSDLVLSDNIFRNENNLLQRIDAETNNVMKRIYGTEDEYRLLLQQYTDEKNVKITTHSLNLREDVEKIIEESQNLPKKILEEAPPSTSVGDRRRVLRNKGFKHRERVKKAAYLDKYAFDESD